MHVEQVGTPEERIVTDLETPAASKAVVLFAGHPAPGQAAAALTAPEDDVKQRGSLCVVGLGPGAGLMTGQAQDVLRHAEVVIGYEGDLAGLLTCWMARIAWP